MGLTTGPGAPFRADLYPTVPTGKVIASAEVHLASSRVCYLALGDQSGLHPWPTVCTGFPGGSVVKNPPANAGDVGSIPGSGRSPGEGNGNPLQYSCLENPHGERSLVGYSPWGRTSAGHDLVTSQQQQCAAPTGCGQQT